ncbi:MAG: polysaccharide lyase family 8 super-sandwich domain-containing protein [Rikenellaceae bacterium]
MNRKIYCAILLMMTVVSSFAMNKQDDIALIKRRYSDYYASIAPSEQSIRHYLDSLNLESGGWCDIDYESTIGSGWRTKEHTRRTMCMAQYYAKGDDFKDELFSRKELSTAIHSAWSYWFREKPHCPTNWYPNMLSCPHELGISFMLMQDEMSQEECENAVKLVYNKSKLAKTGSNLIYVANTALMQGIFQRDTLLIQRAIDAISSTIFIATEGEEGIQSDYSYHLHGAQQQMGNYGREAIKILSPFCEVLSDTSFDFTLEQKDILLNLITKGFRWFMWRGYMDMIASGRQYGPDMFKFKGDNILESSQRIALAGTAEQRAEVAAMVAENIYGNPITLVGQKYFDKSDCFIHRCEGWSASLKMHSTRVSGTEMSNNDNRRGFYSPDGALYIYVDGGDYENAPALWDWSRVPGITCHQTPKSRERTVQGGIIEGGGINNGSNFVGACSNGTQGMAAMILDKDNQHYRKSWLLTSEFVLCLGGDLYDVEGATLTTSIEQRLLDGELTILRRGEWHNVEGRVVQCKSGVRLHHHKCGYITLDDNECEASVEERAGNWNDVTFGVDPMSVNGKMVSIFLRHTKQHGGYKYLILPNKTQEEVAKFDVDQIKILANDRDLQLVYYDGQYYATAYTSGEYKISKGVFIDIKQPGIFIFSRGGSGWSVIAHDPTQQLTNEEMRSQMSIIER